MISGIKKVLSALYWIVRSCRALFSSTSFFIYSVLGLLNSENKMAAALSSSTNSEPNMIQADVVPASGKDEISAIQGLFLSFFIRFVSILIIIK